MVSTSRVHQQVALLVKRRAPPSDRCGKLAPPTALRSAFVRLSNAIEKHSLAGHARLSPLSFIQSQVAILRSGIHESFGAMSVPCSSDGSPMIANWPDAALHVLLISRSGTGCSGGLYQPVTARWLCVASWLSRRRC